MALPHTIPLPLRSAARAIDTWRAPRLAPGALREVQWRRLRRLVKHAFEHSPSYRRKMDAAGMRPDDLRRLEDLSELPVTTREELREGDGLVIPAMRGATRHSLTSGSTGRPTVSHFDTDGWLLAKLVLKLRARHECGMRPWDRLAMFQETDREVRFPRSLLPVRNFSVHAEVEDILPSVERFRPSVFYGFPGHLRQLAEVAGGRLRPRLIFTSGELLGPVTRRDIEEGFGAPVFDVYGCTETKEIAWQCEERRDYHINADWILLESAGGDEAGVLRVTSLYNYAMPLIRYEMGDQGLLRTHRCACGRVFPLMSPSSGRSVDYFRLPDGRSVSPYSLTRAIEEVPGMRQYQIVQHAVDRACVRVVPDTRFDAAAPARIAELLRPVLPGVKVRVETREKISPEASGKYRIVRSEIGEA